MSIRFSVLIFYLLATVVHAEPAPARRYLFFKPPTDHTAQVPTPAPAPGAEPRSPLFDGPPLPKVTEQDLRNLALLEVEQLVKEVATNTIEAQRVAAVNRVNEILKKLMEKNLSRPEMQVLLGILQFATAEQIQLGTDKGPFAYLAKSIYAQLEAQVGGTPEVKAVKILAKQVADFMKLTPAEKKRFGVSLQRYKDAFIALGDKEINGHGIFLLLAASVHTGKGLFDSVFLRIKGLFDPVKLETTLKAMGLLANSAVNPDPISKDILRTYLNEELDKHRVVKGRDGSVAWKETIEGFSEEDAKNLAQVLLATKVLKERDFHTVLKIADYASEVRTQVNELQMILKEDPEGKSINAEAIRFPEHFLSIARGMATSREIADPNIAKKIFQIAASAAAAQASRELDEALKTPAGQWNPPPNLPRMQPLPPISEETQAPAPVEEPFGILRRLPSVDR